MQKVTGLWKSESRNGRTYYSGRVGNTRLMVFKTDKSRAQNPDKAPDLELLVAKVDDEQEWTMLPQEEAGTP